MQSFVIRVAVAHVAALHRFSVTATTTTAPAATTATAAPAAAANTIMRNIVSIPTIDIVFAVIIHVMLGQQRGHGTSRKRFSSCLAPLEKRKKTRKLLLRYYGNGDTKRAKSP